jgi:DNA-binding CsgD family transcriptional regulator
LLAGVSEDSSAAEILAHAKRALSSGDSDAPQLLVVDDAQRLDAGSAMLLHQVIVEDVCRCVATVRAGEPAPEDVSRLWASGHAGLIELAGLSLADTVELLGGVLGGPVDPVTARRLWEASGGNALYLKELVLEAAASGALRDERGSWRLGGSTRVPRRLVELISARLAALDGPARSALDVLAVADRIDLDALPGLVDPDVLGSLVEAELVDVGREAAGRLVTFAHPLYGEAVRAAMPAVRRRQLCGKVADAVEAAGMKRPGDIVRVVTCRLDAGQPVVPDLLTTAARRAYNGNDFELAARLATAARRAGAGVDAGLVLAETWMITGHHDDAAALLAELATEARTDRERVDVADDRTITLGLLLGREQEAVAVATDALAHLDPPELADPLRASLAVVLLQIPRPAAAIEAARPLLDRPDDPLFYRGAYAASMALAISGALDDAIELGWRAHETHEALGAAIRFRPEAQFIAPVYALCGAGRLDEAALLASRGFDAAVAARDTDLQATFALFNGLVAVQRGRLRSARRHFNEAAALDRQLNDVAALRWALGGVALAAGMGGDAKASDAAIADLANLSQHSVQLHELGLVQRGSGWALAATGARSAAVETLRSAADRAADTGLLVDEATLRHDLVRLGEARTERRRLAELAQRIDGALVPAYVDHTDALLSGSGRPLEEAARSLAGLGVDLVAAEAALDAADAYRRERLQRRATECGELADQLLERCEGIRSAAKQPHPELAWLTKREHEVATLAEAGLTNRQIAERLSLSPRTVENHLQNVFVKLGIAGRHDLHSAFVQPQR